MNSYEDKKLTKQEYNYIKNKILEFNIKYKIKKYPIDMFKLIKKMGVILVKYYSLTNEYLELALKISEDGFTMCRDGKIIVCYNDRIETEGRINFTLAHEIGHIVLGHSEHCALAEKQATFFAKYFLAPPPIVDHLKIENIEDYREQFNLSNEASKYMFDYYLTWKRKFLFEPIEDIEEKLILNYIILGGR